MGLTGEQRCATCGHWQPPGKVDGPRGQCQEILHGHGDEETAELAVVADYAGSGAWLYTKPEFGCVLWEAKARA